VPLARPSPGENPSGIRALHLRHGEGPMVAAVAIAAGDRVRARTRATVATAAPRIYQAITCSRVEALSRLRQRTSADHK